MHPSSWQIAGLADDLTGAMEAGALLAESGLATSVSLRWPPPAGPGAIVVDLATRHLPARVASEAVASASSAIRQSGTPVLYKKTDSTLRGPLGEEIEALRCAWRPAPVFYLPAYPRLGRTVREGRLYIEGRPLEETAFARDPRNPVSSSSIAERLRPFVKGPVYEVGLACPLPAAPEAGAVYIFDAETDADLHAVTRIWAQQAPLPALAGPAGVAASLAWLRSFSRTGAVDPAIPRTGAAKPGTGLEPIRGLVVGGSLHPASRAQMRHASLARRTDVAPVRVFPDEAPALSSDVQECGWARLESALPAGPVSDAAAAETGRQLAAAAARLVQKDRLEAVVVFGGDTARAFLEALGVSAVRAIGELAPGVPAGWIRYDKRELALATKAGGFGPPHVLDLVLDRMAGFLP